MKQNFLFKLLIQETKICFEMKFLFPIFVSRSKFFVSGNKNLFRKKSFVSKFLFQEQNFCFKKQKHVFNIKLSKICNQLTEISKFKIIAYLL